MLGDVPKALPALTRAAKLGKRASRVGFDWPDVAGIRDKMNEELAELDAARPPPTGPPPAMAEELGDVLFTLVNLGRKLDAGSRRGPARRQRANSSGAFGTWSRLPGAAACSLDSPLAGGNGTPCGSNPRARHKS